MIRSGHRNQELVRTLNVWFWFSTSKCNNHEALLPSGYCSLCGLDPVQPQPKLLSAELSNQPFIASVQFEVLEACMPWVTVQHDRN